MPRKAVETVLYSLKFSLSSAGDILFDTETVDPVAFVKVMDELQPDYPHTETIASFIRSAKVLGEEIVEKLEKQLEVT